MGPQVQLSTYSQEFSYPVQAKLTLPRPSSAHRRNNPHPRPDFLLPRKPQTGYGHRLMFPMVVPPNNSPLFPPVRHKSVQWPDGKSALKPSHTDSNSTGYTAPPTGWPTTKLTTDITRALQAQGSDKNLQRKISGSIPPIRPFKSHLMHTRPRSKSSDSSGGYSCFHIVKPYKAGYYIIHPEFMSERQH